MRQSPGKKKIKLFAFLILALLFAALLIEDILSGRPAAPEVSESPSASPAEPSPTAEPKITIGYYTSWSASSAFTPDDIAADKLDFVHYAFASVGTDYKVAAGQSELDSVNFEQLRALKKANPTLKTLISVGGWGGSEGFSEMASSDETRKTFAQSCIDFVRLYGFDGVDIDWEYPGLAWGAAADKANDTNNFTLLMKQLRETLGTSYLLTFAGYVKDKVAVTGGYEFMDIAAVMPYVDFVNIMTLFLF